MSYRFTNYKNQKFGRLEARAADPKNKKPGTYWWFLCECSSYKSMRVTNVLNGRTKSCGCLRKEYFTRLRGELSDIAKLQKALDIAFRAMSHPKVYMFHDNDVKNMNNVLYGRTGE